MPSNPELLKAVKALMYKAVLELHGQLLLAEYDYWTTECEYHEGKITTKEYLKIQYGI